MATVRLQHRTYWATIRIPQSLQPAYGGKKVLNHNLQTGDLNRAKQLAAVWEGAMRLEFMEKAGTADDTSANLRKLYETTRQKADAGQYAADVALPSGPIQPHHAELTDPVLAGIDFELDSLAEIVGERDLTPAEQARVDALQDTAAIHRGRTVPKRSAYEAPFWEVAQEYMRQWKAKQNGKKETNTEQQKLATYNLFKGFWDNKPMRGIQDRDAATFHDMVRLLEPSWARSPDARKLGWKELQTKFGNRPKGLSASTMNRHMTSLKALWEWARKRGHCSGDNPFEGFRQTLKAGVNTEPYVAWNNEELAHLLNPPPARADVLEVILVGMFTGMRLNEIAALTWGHLRVHGEDPAAIHYFQIVDAKTPAGNRQVPLHPALSWLRDRTRGKASDRIWSKFNAEGPGEKPGADAGREFSTFKLSRGFASRAKAFHSFRKNVTRIMERAGVPENEWAQIFGHERGFTYRVYNQDGITMEHKEEIIKLISYPTLTLPVIKANSKEIENNAPAAIASNDLSRPI